MGIFLPRQLAVLAGQLGRLVLGLLVVQVQVSQHAVRHGLTRRRTLGLGVHGSGPEHREYAWIGSLGQL